MCETATLSVANQIRSQFTGYSRVTENSNLRHGAQRDKFIHLVVAMFGLNFFLGFSQHPPPNRVNR